MAIVYHVKGEARLATQLRQQNAREIKAGRPALVIVSEKEKRTK